MEDSLLTSVFPGCLVMVALPRVTKLVPALCEQLHGSNGINDLAEDASGKLVEWNGGYPRITALYVTLESNGITSYVRQLHVPHRSDVENAVMLADGNLRNLENCPYYLIVKSFDCV